MKINKLLSAVLVFCLLFCTSVSFAAETETDAGAMAERTPAVNEEMPKKGGERQGGMREGLGTHPNGEMPTDFVPPEMPADFVPPEMPNGEMPPQNNNGTQSENTEQTTDENSIPDFGGGRMPSNMPGGEPYNFMQNEETQKEDSSITNITDFIKTYQTPIISVIMLALAFVFVIFYKRKNY